MESEFDVNLTTYSGCQMSREIDVNAKTTAWKKNVENGLAIYSASFFSICLA